MLMFAFIQCALKCQDTGHRWRIGRLRRECSKARDTSGREWSAREPSGNTVEIEGRSRSDVLQARLGQTAIARPAQAEGPHALGQRALHSLALRVEAPAFRRALPGPAAARASYSRLGRRASTRPWGPDRARVQRVRDAQARQSAARNRARMELRWPGRLALSNQPVLSLPSGQRATRLSQSTAKSAALKASSARLCQLWSGRAGPTRSMPYCSWAMMRSLALT